MKVKYYPAKGAMETREVDSLEDIQRLVGGWVELVHFDHPTSDSFLVDEEGLLKNKPRNPHFPQFTGDVVVAGEGWEHLPYSLEGAHP